MPRIDPKELARALDKIGFDMSSNGPRFSLASELTDHAATPHGGSVAAAWPVGSVFVSVVATNPATLLGFGTWSAFGAGRVLVGLDAADTSFDVAEETGGAKAVAAAGTNSTPAFTGSALATHAHQAGTITPSAHAGATVADHSAISAHSGATVGNHTFTQPTAHSNHVVTQPANHVVTQPATHSAHAALATHAHELPFIKVAGATGALRMLASSIFGTGTSRAPESVSAAPTALTTAAAVALSQAVSAGTPDAHSAHSGTAVDAHSGTAVDAHSAHSGGAVDAHTVGQAANHSAISSHTVGQANAHTMSGTSEAVTAGTPAGTVSTPTFTGSATSVVQPYIVVRLWKRTA